jgi:hypothetical protein
LGAVEEVVFIVRPTVFLPGSGRAFFVVEFRRRRILGATGAKSLKEPIDSVALPRQIFPTLEETSHD